MRYLVEYPAPSPSPRPALLVLHGYGENEQSLALVADHASSLGLVGVSVAGPVPLDADHFHWPVHDAARTHNLLRDVLRQVQKAVAIDPDRVLLAGFSQGGLHAVVLLANYASFYRGVLAFSPGGWLALPPTMPDPDKPRPLVLSQGADELPGTLETADACQKLWRSAEFPLRVVRHDAVGHQLPGDWPARLDDLMKPVGV